MTETLRLNHDVTHDDCYLVIDREIREYGFTHHAISSVNHLYNTGIEQIFRDVYVIEGLNNNKRTRTREDQQVDKIGFRVKLDNVRMGEAEALNYDSGHDDIIFPIQAHREDRTYSANITVDVLIEAWAIKKDGTVENKPPVKLSNHRLCPMPVMVRSEKCNTFNKSKASLLKMKEDPMDPGGYFIKGGKEWSIDSMESICFNQPRVFNNQYGTEMQRVEFISKPGDTYQNSKQVIIRLHNNTWALTLEISINVLRETQFPFHLIMRAMGWSTDKEILDNILYCDVGYPGGDNVQLPPLKEKMYNILRKCFGANYNNKNNKFTSPNALHSQNDVLTFLVKNMKRDRDMSMDKPDHVQQAITDLKRQLDEELLPHMGMTQDSRHVKLRYLAHLINRMLLVHLGVLDPTDRDSYTTKRIHLPGITLAKTIKTHFNSTVVIPIKRQFDKDFKNMSFNLVNLQNTYSNSFNGKEFERALLQSISSGNQTSIKVRNTQKTNRLSSQLVDRKNMIKVYSTSRMIIAPNQDNSKNSDRAKEMRMPHLSFQGFADLVQSPEGGEKVGLHKQMAISASVSGFGSSQMLRERLLKDPLVLPLCTADGKNNPDCHPYLMDSLAKVFVNGYWLGCCKDSSQLVERYTNLRRKQEIDDTTTIEWDTMCDEIHFWIDFGRIKRPVIIVYNNMRDWKALGLKGPAPLKNFEQGVCITPKIVQLLQSGEAGIRQLVKMQIIEYLTPNEQIRMLIAADVNHLKDNMDNPLLQFTHCDIPEAMLGIASLTGPLANYNQTTRNTFQTSQVRQTGGYYAHNWAHRIDKDTFLQYQVDQPLVFTRINNYIPPNGSMCIVAVNCYTGYNEEDSLIVNKASSERLKFNGCWFTYDKVELMDRHEEFKNPDANETNGIKQYAVYDKLNHKGWIPVGTVVYKNDVVVGKVKRLSKHTVLERNYKFQDQSVYYKYDFPSIVHSVQEGKDEDGTQFIKISYRSLKPVIIGDKFSARSGQKGVCGLPIRQSMMPFTSDGRAVDIIMNPHSYPKRMTIGQQYECAMGKVCAKRGVTCDGTQFREIEMEPLIREMEKLGMKPGGYERMYCGHLGTWINALIFSGPVFYQRLQKFVAKSVYPIDVGPTDILTRQPLDGKANQGGLRLSELQRDVLLSHGAARFFSEKFFEDSDDFEVYVCRCGNRAIVNPALDIYRCKQCGDNADICVVPCSWSSKLFFQELNACHIGTKQELEPMVFYRDL